ncbi:MAG: hypothetical protein ACRYFZ_15910 [Janthinobacterium lividum]
MPKKKNIPKPATTLEVAASQDAGLVELGEIVELLSVQIVSLVLPPFEGDIKFIEDVVAYTFEIGTRPQSSADYYFRFFVDIACIIHFKDDATLRTTAQSVTVFKVLPPVEKSKEFKLSMLPKHIVQAAIGIAYSTTRGLYLAKCSGTILQGAMLPIIAPINLMTDSRVLTK